ncbi:MAG: hypothetical protein LBV79_08540 [Candidatus Adiutrix sp.]|jgi:hypothetical protein|nr:hypothetical protein [Candidatus Adiutrix sp.]
MTGPVLINSVFWLRRLWSAWRGKRRNKDLMDVLARYNLELRAPEWILAAVGVEAGDMVALAGLAEMREGWLGWYVVLREKVPGDYNRLARLGLIQFKRGTIYLTDAGRYLLSLTA